MRYTTINIQGNLISEEILQKIESGDAQGQQATDFGFEPGSNIRSEIEYAWSRIKLDWKHFSDKSQNLPASDPYGTTLSRKWMEQFLSSIGFDLSKTKAGLQGDNNQSYTISHVADNLSQLPVHIVGFIEPNNPDKNTLDVKSSGGTSRFSPHATMQEYLNVTEHVYGIAANGLFLRLIRDSGRLIKLTYVEFDLKRMLDEDKYSEFTLLYRLLHATRFPRTQTEADQCFLEKYYQDSIETGNRIRDGLSLAVKESLLALGNGFLQHESNAALREKIQNGQLSSKDYYRQLLRIIYRFLFLMVTEERDLVYDPEDKTEATQRLKRIYLQFYSIARLRKLCENRYVYESQFNDLWQGLVQTFQLFEAGGNGKKLGIQPLDGDLFSYTAIKDLQECLISNKLLLECVRNMNEFRDEKKNLVNINYRSLDVEELGSVYEGLLELHPVIENIEATNPAHINFTFHEGTDRKTTGSYYTRPELVNELIKSALIPVIEERLKENTGNKEAQAKALLKLKVCDAAAGSGHMLLAAARTIAWYLARVKSGEENPAPSVYRSCLREVIQHCIYAVDFNPDAVELCKLALWLEGHNSGKPLSFLDHKIRNGNSLVGVSDLSVLQKGIPDDAFNPVPGDDKKVCQELKKENAKYNKTKQTTIDFDQSGKIDTTAITGDYKELENIRQDDVEGVKQVKTKFDKLRSNHAWFNDWRACNLWTAAFFWNYTEENKQAAPNSERLAKFLQNPAAAYGPMIGKADALSMEHKFFHWPLEFPDVFEQGGFDVMLGNPPWERIKLQEVEFFASRDASIAKTDKKSERSKLIKQLPQTNPRLYNEFQNALHFADAQSKFIRQSERFPLTGVGDINTYAIFAEHFYHLINKNGRMSILLPTGIATDEGTSNFFKTIVDKGQLESFWGYKNEKFLFPKPVEHTVTFGILNVAGKENNNRTEVEFCWLAYTVEEANDKRRRIILSVSDLKKVNPNTHTSPIPRTQYDAQLLLKYYNNNQILINYNTQSNPWKIKFSTCFHMSNDSSEFYDSNSMVANGYSIRGNWYIMDDNKSIPLYESKMSREYDHRFGSYSEFNNRSNSMLPTPAEEQYQNSNYIPQPWYWVSKNEVVKRLADIPSIVMRNVNKDENSLKVSLLTWIFKHPSLDENEVFTKIKKLKANAKKTEIIEKSIEAIYESELNNIEAYQVFEVVDSPSFNDVFLEILERRCKKWLLGFRNVARSTDERTGIFSVIPFSGVGNSFPLIVSKYENRSKIPCLIGNLCSIPFDWVVRQKVAGVNLNFFYVEQLPIVSPEKYNSEHISLINPRIIELIFTSWDIKTFADDVWKEADAELKAAIQQQWEANQATTGGHAWAPPEWSEIEPEGCPLPPFKWDEARRAVLKAELDAIYAKLYGLTTEELRYILDPQDVYGPDFPGETFRVLKEKEIKQFGEYRTRRLVLEAWERLNNKEVNDLNK